MSATLRDQIRAAIRQSGKSRYAIAKAAGIDQSPLSKFMRGGVGLSLESLEKIASVLSLEITLRPARRPRTSLKIVARGMRRTSRG